jgi:hypothetical protein
MRCELKGDVERPAIKERRRMRDSMSMCLSQVPHRCAILQSMTAHILADPRRSDPSGPWCESSVKAINSTIIITIIIMAINSNITIN